MSRPPRASLRPLVRTVWVSSPDERGAPAIERVVPTGCAHVVLRLSDDPLTLLDAHGARPRVVACAVVGGPRSSFYVRAVAPGACSVGAQLEAGAAPALFGVSARELAEAHLSLEDLWGPRAELARAALVDAPSDSERLDLFEQLLESELRRARAVDPVVLFAVARLARGVPVADIVAESGYSHRAFVARFSDAVGLAPKSFGRVLRVQRALAALRRGRAPAEVATGAGYSDQAHLTRELVAIAGVTPAAYRRIGPSASNHVPFVARQGQLPSRRRP